MSYNRNSPAALLGLAGIIPNPHIGTIQRNIEGGPLSGFGGSRANASPALQAVQQSTGADRYRPPTQIYQRSVFGNSFRDATPEDRSGYNVQHLQDIQKHNVH